MRGIDQKATFIEAARAAIAGAAFVRLTLGKYRGAGESQKAVATLVNVKDKPRLCIVFSHPRKDITETKSIEESLQRIADLLGEDFMSATLFTTAKDVTLSYNKKKEPQLSQAKPSVKIAPQLGTHNREKTTIIAPSRPYLKELGLTQDGSTVKPSMFPKFKQICHFIEIIDDLIRLSPLKDAAQVSVADIGSGKGYLTFALYDYLTGTLGKTAAVSGIEVQPDLVDFCNDLAKQSRFSGLSFEAASAAQATRRAADILIALHACDTATDDAIAEGIAADAKLIITAPCCQHELAPQISQAANGLEGLVKFGLFKQRLADLVTDAARCLLLEACGYKVKVVEFVPLEHTAKNVLIAATRVENAHRSVALRNYESLKNLTGFTVQHLEKRLKETGAIGR